MIQLQHHMGQDHRFCLRSAHLRSGVAAFLEAGLAAQRAAQGGGVMVQTEGGAGHNGGLR